MRSKFYIRPASNIQNLRIGRPFWLLCVLAIVIGGVVMNVFFFYLVTWRHLLSGASLGFFGYAFGGSLALLAKMEKPQVSLANCQNAL